MIDAAASSWMSDVRCDWKNASESGAVRMFWPESITSESRKSFHVHMKTSTTIVRIAGRPYGTSTRSRTPRLEAPSIRAASMSERGAERKNARIQNVPKAIESAVLGRITPQTVSVSPMLPEVEVERDHGRLERASGARSRKT